MCLSNVDGYNALSKYQNIALLLTTFTTPYDRDYLLHLMQNILLFVRYHQLKAPEDVIWNFAFRFFPNHKSKKHKTGGGRAKKKLASSSPLQCHTIFVINPTSGILACLFTCGCFGDMDVVCNYLTCLSLQTTAYTSLAVPKKFCKSKTFDLLVMEEFLRKLCDNLHCYPWCSLTEGVFSSTGLRPSMMVIKRYWSLWAKLDLGSQSKPNSVVHTSSLLKIKISSRKLRCVHACLLLSSNYSVFLEWQKRQGTYIQNRKLWEEL
jgi:hypothetical protein